VESLVINVSITSYATEVREHIPQFDTRLYSEQFNWRPKLDGHTFNSVDDDKTLWLERAFEESEVLEVVKALNSDKAPGPDGFSLAFFKSYWEVLK
jgi:hypothetical protein